MNRKIKVRVTRRGNEWAATVEGKTGYDRQLHALHYRVHKFIRETYGDIADGIIPVWMGPAVQNVCEFCNRVHNEELPYVLDWTCGVHHRVCERCASELD